MIPTRRPGIRAGYDLWAESYDATPNPLVALDRRHTLGYLAPAPGERIVDAACGTGRHLAALVAAGARPVGCDLSQGMLRVARRRVPHAALVQADLELGLPLREHAADAILCALAGEHIKDLSTFFRAARRSLRPGGRVVFSVYHPAMVAAGTEANFARDGAEYRLGAQRHRLEDYLHSAAAAGLDDVAWREHRGDDRLAREIRDGRKYLGRPLLLVVTARRAA